MITVVVTGAAGFIGSNFVRLILEETNVHVVIVDKLTYAGHPATLVDLENDGRVIVFKDDITDEQAMQSIFHKYKPTWIVNCAAESHVDRSIDNPEPFLKTNTFGTYVLLEAARRFLVRADEHVRRDFRFLHVSTDEVFGSLGPEGKFSESSPYAPNSPYAASKGAADHFVRAYWHTYRVPTLITNCSNNYGPYQFPEKLIPLTILNALDGKPLRIYGDGLQVRDWLYVKDHCQAILQVLRNGRAGESYNIGGEEERTNREVVEGICDILQELMPANQNTCLVEKNLTKYTDLRQFVEDRPGHDQRYAIDPGKIRSELRWSPGHTFEVGLRKTVEWYLSHREWCRQVLGGRYDRQRLGLLAHD
ncbi:dTDP-glucose 4,6-dehydratase [Nitrospira sp. BLG_1]|uniref:dTDP-glucose 4,6-dehydratase n=1 Tax=Nitrospira sp. BLG_1 TaxID=3395883 RepID=UPI0039BD4D73